MRTSFGLGQGQVSKLGPVGVPVTMLLAAVAQVQGDLGLEQMGNVIDYIKSVWIDNSGNAQAFTLTVPGTQQSIIAKAHSQGVYPIISAIGIFSWISASGGAVNVPCIFMNQDFPYCTWLTQ